MTAKKGKNTKTQADNAQSGVTNAAEVAAIIMTAKLATVRAK
jgi:hypothetical protein